MDVIFSVTPPGGSLSGWAVIKNTGPCGRFRPLLPGLVLLTQQPGDQIQFRIYASTLAAQ